MKYLALLIIGVMSCQNNPTSPAPEPPPVPTVYCFQGDLIQIQEDTRCLEGLVCRVKDLGTGREFFADVEYFEPTYTCQEAP